MSSTSWSQLPKYDKSHKAHSLRRHYGLGVALCVLGLLVLAVSLGSVMQSARQGLQRVSFPGSHELHLRGGIHMGVTDTEKMNSRGNVPAFNVIVEEVSTGYNVPVMMNPPSQVSLRSGPAAVLFQFQTPDPGLYRLRAVTDGISPDPWPVLLMPILLN